MPANGFDSLLISAHPQFPSETFALIDWENGRMEFSVGTGCITAYATAACLVLSSQIPGCDQNPKIAITNPALRSTSRNCDHIRRWWPKTYSAAREPKKLRNILKACQLLVVSGVIPVGRN